MSRAEGLRAATRADADAIARVHVQGWRETYAGLLPQAALDRLDAVERAEMWRGLLAKDDRRAHVLEAGGEVVGFVAAGVGRDEDPRHEGEVYALYLLRAHQGRGHGAALLREGARSVAALGLRGMRLWVLASNPACGFYARMGGRLVGEREDEVEGARVREVAYGWREARELLRP